jgi:KUP system potassium uptake protein
LILRIDQHGEGGIFALLGLIRTQPGAGGGNGRKLGFVTGLILLGAALLYGDGIITPSISVLSACEGLEVATSALKPLVVPVTLVVLLLLFLFQKRGSGRVGKAFGPLMVLWFVVIGAVGIPWILRHPEVLQAVNPVYGIQLLVAEGWHCVYILGAVVLCITGGEALFADLGHFGRGPIRLSWFSLIYPALLLNYFGQGARLLDPAEVVNGHLFYALFPQENWIFLPTVALATVATVIASQALISGAFSLTRQAIALGFLPRLRIVFTSAEVEGQIYMPGVNWLLFMGCAVLVVGFKTSTALAAAYGIAVTGTMAITTFAFYQVARTQGWKPYLIGPLCAILIGIDLSFFLSNTWKFLDGGYVPIVVAGGLLILMRTWQWGRSIMAEAYRAFTNLPMQRFIELKQRLMDSPGLRVDFGERKLAQIERSIVFLASRPILSVEDPCPVGLRIFLKRTGALPKHVILLNVMQVSRPYVPEEERYEVVPLGANIVAVNAQYGYMQSPDIPTLLRTLKRRKQVKIHEHRWTVQIGEEDIILDRSLSTLHHWGMRLFRTLLRISTSADRYFGLMEFAGRAKTMVPVRVSEQGARIVVSDDENA